MGEIKIFPAGCNGCGGEGLVGEPPEAQRCPVCQGAGSVLPRGLTLSQVTSQLGISPSTLRTWREAGLECVQVGEGTPVFFIEDLMRFLQNNYSGERDVQEMIRQMKTRS